MKTTQCGVYGHDYGSIPIMSPESEAVAVPPSVPWPEGVRVMKASEFKAKCLKLMDEIAAGAGEIVITKNGRPVSRLARVREPWPDPFGCERGRVQILGDIISPIEDEWEAESNPDRTLNP